MKKGFKESSLIYSILVIFLAAPIQAHIMVHQASGGLVNGLLHPIFGFDHLLAMVAVGILSSQMGGKALWTVPATFVIVMFFGGIISMANIPLFAIELGIALSVLSLGLIIGFGKKLPPLFAMAFVGFFAIFHGYAHGNEIPNLARPVLYSLGSIYSTAGLHITGLFLGEIFRRFRSGKIMFKATGFIIAAIGIYFLFFS